MHEIEHVPGPMWRQWVDANRATIIDVREPVEWADGTLPGAERVSLGELPHRIASLDRSIPTLVVCRSGARSARAAEFLSRAGFRSVANLVGGMVAVGMAT